MTRENLSKELTRIWIDEEGLPKIEILPGEILGIYWNRVKIEATSQLIDQYVAEVIGEDEEPNREELFQTTKHSFVRNELRKEQRKQAGLPEKP